MIQEWKAVFGLTKGKKESYFWFVKKGNLGRKACVWLMLIEKKIERVNCENSKSFMVIFVNFPTNWRGLGSWLTFCVSDFGRL